MTEEEKEKWKMVKYRKDNEGFHYCFKSYSTFDEIKDEEFHKLRKQYLKIVDKLNNYIEDKVKQF